MENPPPDNPESAQSPAVIELDLRELEPPGPMVEILSTLEAMKSHDRLVALLPRNPIYLLPRIDQLGHSYTIAQRERDTWELRVTKSGGPGGGDNG